MDSSESFEQVNEYEVDAATSSVSQRDILQ